MPTEKEVYQDYAGDYELLVAREDYQNNILRAVEQICLLKGLDVLDLGAGTGRVTRLLAPHVATIKAYDASWHMIARASSALQALNLTNWRVGVADHRQLPEPDASVDLVISGWSFCYLAVWGGEQWRTDLEAGYREIRRILRPGGHIIILETLGTGQESPFPPQHLADYFGWLGEKGFQSTWIRTDYRFKTLDEAAQLSSFFFGKQMEELVILNNWTVLPECTGVWWQKVPL